MGTIIIGLLVLAIVGLSIRKLVKDKKSGKTSCGCGCSCCPKIDERKEHLS